MAQTITVTTEPAGSRVVSALNTVGEGFWATLKDVFKTIAESMPSMVDLALVVVTTASCLYIIKQPWDNYFHAKKALVELEANKTNGVEINPQDEKDVRWFSVWLLRAAVGIHFVSAATVYGLSFLTDGKILNARTALVFLGSGLVRPAWAAHNYVKSRIAAIFNRIQHPETEYMKFRREVGNFQEQLSTIERRTEATEKNVQNLVDEHNKLREMVKANYQKFQASEQGIKTQLQQLDHREADDKKQLLVTIEKSQQQVEARIKQSDLLTTKSYDQLTVKFEETVIKLDQDKRMIEGVKQFCQLVRANLLQNESATK